MNIKNLPRAYNNSTARLVSELPGHDVVRRRRDGTVHQVVNIYAGKGLEIASDAADYMTDTRALSTCPTDEADVVYSVDIIPKEEQNVSENLLHNSAFEHIDAVFEKPLYWVLPTGAEIAHSTYYGKNALKITVAAGATVQVYQKLPNTSFGHLTKFTLSAWAKNNGYGSLELAIVGRDGLADSSRSIASSTIGFTEWQREVSSGGFGVPIYDILVSLKVSNSSASTAIWYIDAVQLEESEQVTVWKPLRLESSVWNNVDSSAGYEITVKDGDATIPLEYCDSDIDFFSRAVPHRAVIDTSVTFASANNVYKSKVDYWGKEHLTYFDVSGDKIRKMNLDVSGEVIASYDLYTPSLFNTIKWAYSYSDQQLIDEFIKFQYTPSQLTMLRDLLYILSYDATNGYEILCVNPQWQEPEIDGLYLLNRIIISDENNVLSQPGITLTLGRDYDDPDSLAIRSISGDTHTDYKIKLWYDYFVSDGTGDALLLREDYSSYGGVQIR